jgi:hypothetical protein
MTDWSSSEKDKIWQSACDENGNYQDLTFEQFKALIIGEGGFHLKAKVEGMAATAQAAQIDTTNESVGYQLVGLTQGMPSAVSIPQLAPVAPGIRTQTSSCAISPADAGDWPSANSFGSCKAALGGDGPTPQANGSTSAGTLPVFMEHSQSGFDVDTVDGNRQFKRRSSSIGRMQRSGAGSGDFSDSDDERDENGNLQPKLLTKRTTGNNGGSSSDLHRSASEGAPLRSPHAPHRRAPYAFSNAPPATPSGLPKNRSRNQLNAANKASSSNTSVPIGENRNGASPDSVAEHGFTCTTGQEITGSPHTTSVTTQGAETLVCFPHIFLQCPCFTSACSKFPSCPSLLASQNGSKDGVYSSCDAVSSLA